VRFVKTCDSLHPADEAAFSWLFQAPEGAAVEMVASKKRRSTTHGRQKPADLAAADLDKTLARASIADLYAADDAPF